MSTLLLEHLIDDAALFPPGNAPMIMAIGVHRAVKVGPLGWLVGRFVCPASRVEEAIGELHPGDAFAFSLLAGGGVLDSRVALALEQVRADDRLTLLAVETAVPAGGDVVAAVRETLAVLPRDVRCYIELPRVPQWESALAVIAAARHGAKLRTGGVGAKDFPSEREVADFVSGCVVAGVPFKCSAGLHRAVRHVDRRRRVDEHGFLNIALSVCAAVRGEDPLPVLGERDAALVAAAVRDVDDETAARARSLYSGFGSCSIAEPAGDLLTLGLLEGGPE
ncbi:MAG: hypothetical protein DLM59_18710 [Pseudonocardiales bacterium]|nr:MAG: hypothetical protein DLM59_18710 [Pseudonocardiales bacterium]